MIEKCKKYLSENGRSITEMIAVVVIISVLTITGLALYWYVLNRQRTNALTAELSSMAITTSIKLSQPNPDVQIRGNLEYSYSGTINNDHTFTITVSDVPWGVCRILKADNWSLPYEIKVNDVLIQNGGCQKANTLAFSFHNSLWDGAHPELEESQGETPEPQTNFCRPNCRAGCKETCKTKTYWCWENGCACFNGKTLDSGCTQDPPCSQEYTEVINCDGTTTLCCPDRSICEQPDCGPTCSVEMVSVNNCDGTTTECCPDDESCRDETNCCQTPADCPGGTGYECINNHCVCPSGRYIGSNAVINADPCENCCYPCDAIAKTATSKSECDKCSERAMMEGQCILKVDCSGTPDSFMTDMGTCEPCGSGSSKGALEEDCLSCNSPGNVQRVWIIRATGVPLCMASCNPDYFRGQDQKCYNCTTPSEVITTESACSACGDVREYKNGKCVYSLCADTFLNSAGSCIPCEQTVTTNKDTWLSTEEECNNCGARRWYENGYCVPTCPSGYFQNTNGNCTDCGLLAGKATTSPRCDKCEEYNSAFRRIISGGKCQFPTGTKNCPSGMFKCSTTLDSNVCRLCEDTRGFKSTQSDCDACNYEGSEHRRRMSGDQCVPE